MEPQTPRIHPIVQEIITQAVGGLFARGHGDPERGAQAYAADAEEAERQNRALLKQVTLLNRNLFDIGKVLEEIRDNSTDIADHLDDLSRGTVLWARRSKDHSVTDWLAACAAQVERRAEREPENLPPDEEPEPVAREPDATMPPGCRCDPDDWVDDDGKPVPVPPVCAKRNPTLDEDDFCEDCGHLAECHEGFEGLPPE